MTAPSRATLLYVLLLAAGGAIYVLCRYFPYQAPFWLPWEFSWVTFLAAFLALGWFVRGLVRGERLPPWRIACFLLGVGLDYAVLQTHLDFYAQHMFFVHRAAHFVLHHLGAFLIALGAAGPAIERGMPPFLARLLHTWPVRRAMDVMQHPAVAPALFVGLLYFWLIPGLHTRAMLDADLYDVMNWTMALNGIAFWWLVLDPRPRPPARLSPLIRMLMILLIELPQMVLGAILSLSMTDYYPVYTICGRIFEMTALNDQHYGGLIIWLPGTVTSFAAMIAALGQMRLNEERAERESQA